MFLQFKMPVNVARYEGESQSRLHAPLYSKVGVPMEEPWSRIVSNEPNRNVIASISNAHCISTRRIRKIGLRVGWLSWAANHVEYVL